MAENKSLSFQVTDRQVYQTKNPDVMVVSCPDTDSMNGFRSFPVLANAVKENGQMRTVSLDADRMYDSSIKVQGEDGKSTFEHKTMTGQQLFDIFEANKQKAMEAKSAEKEVSVQAEPEKPVVENVYMNRVSEKLIHPTKDENLVRISVPDVSPEKGMGNIVVPASNVFQAVNKQGVAIPGRFNVNLGAPDAELKYSIRGKDGKFEQSSVTASDIATRYAENQRNFMAARRTADKEAVVETLEPKVDEDEFEID